MISLTISQIKGIEILPIVEDKVSGNYYFKIKIVDRDDKEYNFYFTAYSFDALIPEGIENFSKELLDRVDKLEKLNKSDKSGLCKKIEKKVEKEKKKKKERKRKKGKKKKEKIGKKKKGEWKKEAF